ncbi:hypothetical protein [Mesorhizobium metallidurans]|nr:hypothetical protein [Mesorhizobium metallidurans]
MKAFAVFLRLFGAHTKAGGTEAPANNSRSCRKSATARWFGGMPPPPHDNNDFPTKALIFGTGVAVGGVLNNN